MKIITFDIEEWYVEKKFWGAREFRYKQFDGMLDRVLELLDVTETKATFFCLGKMASDFPYVVRKIVDAGHEIGCHSNEHDWLTKLTPEELRADTMDAIASLEDVTAQKVVSYRAPAFSITEDNKWAIEVLAECGIKNDASIFPAARDFGGYSSFPTNKPCTIVYNGVTLNEFPIPTCKVPILGKDIAYSGGGYFRLFPYWFVSHEIRKDEYSMCYFHIRDLLEEPHKLMSRVDYETYFREPGTFRNRLTRLLKESAGHGTAFKKLELLVRHNRFSTVSSFCNEEGFKYEDVFGSPFIL